MAEAAFTFRAEQRVRPSERKAHDHNVRRLIDSAPAAHARRFRHRPIVDDGPIPGTVPLTGRERANLFGEYVGGWASTSGVRPDEQDPTGRARVSPVAFPLSPYGLRGVAHGDAWTGAGIATHPEVRRETRRPRTDDELRFARLCEARGNCIVWKKPNRRGYGIYKVGGKSVTAARWIWERANGPLPTGMAVRPTCGTRSCVKLDHLVATARAASFGAK